MPSRELSGAHGGSFDCEAQASASIALPNIPDRFFVVEAIRNRGARRVGVVPAVVIERRRLGPAAWHLKIAVRIRLSHPIPGVAEPLAATLLALVREPADFVITPNPVAALSRFSWMSAGAPVIEFHQIRKVLALPAAVCSTSFAAEEDAIEIANLQHSLLRMLWDLLDP